ncbi:MAG: FAD-binding oxidoreductase [Roseovarius sp.]
MTVTILGAGAIGICTALSLAERGETVRLIDRGEPGQETSYGNAGVISPACILPNGDTGMIRQLPKLMTGPWRPLGVRAAHWPRMVPWGLRFLGHCNEASIRAAADAMEHLTAPCIELYRHHLAGTGHEGLVRDCAYIHAYRKPEAVSLESLGNRIKRAKGIDLEIVGADALRRMEPALSPEFKAALVMHGQARALAPGRIHAVLAEKARGMGVAVERSAVHGLRRGADGWTISCEGGRTFAASKVVVAMGAWSAELLKPLGIRVPLAAERGYHLEFPNAGVDLANSVMDTDGKFVASSMEGGVRVAGQVEFGAVDAPPDGSRRARMLRLARRMLPDLGTEEPRFWMGRRPTLPDSLPMLGEFSGQPGLYAAFGHSHWGLMMAPKTGEVMADILTGKPVNTDLSAYSTERFG